MVASRGLDQRASVAVMELALAIKGRAKRLRRSVGIQCGDGYGAYVGMGEESGEVEVYRNEVEVRRFTWQPGADFDRAVEARWGAMSARAHANGGSTDPPR